MFLSFLTTLDLSISCRISWLQGERPGTRTLTDKKWWVRLPSNQFVILWPSQNLSLWQSYPHGSHPCLSLPFLLFSVPGYIPKNSHLSISGQGIAWRPLPPFDFLDLPSSLFCAAGPACLICLLQSWNIMAVVSLFTFASLTDGRCAVRLRCTCCTPFSAGVFLVSKSRA